MSEHNNLKTIERILTIIKNEQHSSKSGFNIDFRYGYEIACKNLIYKIMKIYYLIDNEEIVNKYLD